MLYSAPVDTRQPAAHITRVNKKPRKVQEAATPYPAKKPVKAAPAPEAGNTGVRYMDDAAFKKAADKVFKTHHELFRKLAQ